MLFRYERYDSLKLYSPFSVRRLSEISPFVSILFLYVMVCALLCEIMVYYVFKNPRGLEDSSRLATPGLQWTVAAEFVIIII